MNEIRLIIPGLILLVVLAIASIISSIIMGLNSNGESTLIVMAGIFMFTAPYAILSLVGLIVYHSKRARLIGYTFNLFALIMFAHWITINVVDMPTGISLGEHLSVSIWDTLIHTIVMDILFVIVLVVQAQLIWIPESKN